MWDARRSGCGPRDGRGEAFETARLRLVPATAAHLVADVDADAATLAGLLGTAVPDDWPPETLPEALPIFFSRLKKDPESVGWNLCT